MNFSGHTTTPIISTHTTTATTTTVGDTGTGNITIGCSGIRRVRKNVKSLGSEERQRLVSAMEALIRRGGYQDLANFHGGPPNICNGFCCPHGDPNFLPWHRLYMTQMEEELGEALPYWDWTEDGNLPDLWEIIQAPIKQGETSFCGGGQFVTRENQIQIDTESLKRTTEDAFLLEDFRAFEDYISAPHGELHVSVGCDMSELKTAAYDPLFYLHHSYVDYQWAFWQELQRLRGHPEPNHESFRRPLPPFENSRFNQKDKTFRNHLGEDTFDYRSKFCYQYDQLLFKGKTPAEFLESQTQGFVEDSPSARTDFPAAFAHSPLSFAASPPVFAKKEMLNSRSRPRVKIFVGVVLPREAPSGINAFELCQEGKCVEGGKLGTFGAASSSHDYSGSKPRIDETNYFLRETDVTDLVKKQGWTLEKSLVARMKSSVVESLPEPVVIVKQVGKGGKIKMGQGKIILNPKENSRHYGNLINKYS